MSPSRPVIFDTVLRGVTVTVSMQILSMSPPKFTIFFIGPNQPQTPLTRQEISSLARQAAKISAH